MDLACIPSTRTYLQLALQVSATTETTGLWKGPPVGSYLFTPLHSSSILFFSNAISITCLMFQLPAHLFYVPYLTVNPEGRDRVYTYLYVQHVLNKIGAQHFSIQNIGHKTPSAL